MADQFYEEQNFVFQSKGIVARFVDDQVPPGFYANMENCEEVAENAIASRLGSTVINVTGSTLLPLSGLVHSLNKLSGLNANAWRYAGSGTNLYRRIAAGTGPYTLISATLSGQPWMGVVYRPDLSSVPYLFLADAAGMLKDNGTLIPQQMGIFQPQYPVMAQAQVPPTVIPLDPVSGNTYTTSNIGSFSSNTTLNPNTTTSTAVTSTGIHTVNVVASPNPMRLFQYVVVDTGGNAESVLVLFVTNTGFVANFTKTHLSGVSVTGAGWTGTVASQTTGTVGVAFPSKPIPIGETNAWNQEDYIGLQLYVSDPTLVQSVIIKFDCGDGTFNSDYFYKVIGQGPLQNLINTSTQPTTASADALISQALGLYGNSASSIVQLATSQATWNSLLVQLSDFAGAGRASFTDPVYNWSNVNGYQVTIVNNAASTVTVKLASLVLFGGAGPDSFAGVAYDYLFTFYNNVDGTESNPCMVMTNVSPPLNTNWVVPRRQPVLLTMQWQTPVDTQITSLRIYRRGGTLGDNYRRINEVLITGSPQTYLDTSSDNDIQQNNFISFVNDVPVTSTLPVPVNTTLSSAITSPNTLANVFPASMANISLRQQVSIGVEGALVNNFETVIVQQIFSDHFIAWVQNTHAIGETISATAQYGQPVTIMAQAYQQMWFAGDNNNPHYLYWSAKSNPQAVSSAAFIEVGTPDDPITAIVPFKGNLYVSTRKFWWAIAPGTNANQSPTVYPTATKHGCVAPFGYTVTEEAIYYQSIDGWRAFAGGASSYLSQEIEFLFQDVGTTPIVEADPTQFSQTRMAYWNNMVFLSYIGLDGKRHRLILHTIYKRMRNDDIDAQSLFLEVDTNSLIFGDTNGFVHQDRVGFSDQGNVGGFLGVVPMLFDLTTPYKDQGAGDIQKNYNELTIDIFTNGQSMNVQLLFNDGATVIALGTINTTSRQKVNLNINSGDGQQAYKVALRIYGNVTNQVIVYQAALKHIPLAKTRQSIDTYWLKLGTDESKLVKQCYWEYNAGAAISFSVFYDGNMTTPGYTFTLPQFNGIRNVERVRLPAVKCRLIRIVGLTTADCQIWNDSRLEWKTICSGKGYMVAPLVPN